jgi:hypothetical protein
MRTKGTMYAYCCVLYNSGIMWQKGGPQQASQAVLPGNHRHATSLAQKEVYWGNGRGPGKKVETEKERGKGQEGRRREERLAGNMWRKEWGE